MGRQHPGVQRLILGILNSVGRLLDLPLQRRHLLLGLLFALSCGLEDGLGTLELSLQPLHLLLKLTDLELLGCGRSGEKGRSTTKHKTGQQGK